MSEKKHLHFNYLWLAKKKKKIKSKVLSEMNATTEKLGGRGEEEKMRK